MDEEAKNGKEGKEQNDSFEKHYNKDLDLDEGKLFLFTNQVLCRLSTSCDLWAKWKRD